MSVYLKSLLVCLVIGAGFVYAFQVWKERSFRTAAEGELNFIEKLEKQGLPLLALTTTSGRKFDSKDFQGKLILINFWASWCTPCLEEVPSMLKLVKEMKGKVVLLALSQDSQVGEIDAFMKAYPEVNDPNVYVVWDKDREVAKQFGVDRLPESFLSDSKGKLAKKIIGSIQWYSPDSIKYLESL